MIRFLFWLFASLCVLSFVQDDLKTIPWQKDRPLTWDDFKGKPEKRFAIASTTYDILKSSKQNDKKSGIVTIRAVFFCYKSWSKKQWADNSVLTHEQKHFDIAELYARKLRKLMQETSYSNYASLVSKSDSLYAVIDKEMDVYQDLYDDESDGSMNGSEQKRWSKKVNDEIKALDAYKETAFTVTYATK